MSISADEMMKILRESRQVSVEGDEMKANAPVISHRPKETHAKPTPKRAAISKPVRRPPPPSAAAHVQHAADSKHSHDDELPPVKALEDVHGHCARSLIPDEDGETSGVPCEVCSHRIEELAKVNNEEIEKKKKRASLTQKS